MSKPASTMDRRGFIQGGTAILLSFGALSSIPLGGKLLFAAGNSATATAGDAELGIILGATPIDQGMAIHEKDFTIFNSKIAAAFAVGSNNYWNMTNGSILDLTKRCTAAFP